MSSETRDSIGFVAVAIGFVGLFLAVSSCGKTVEQQTTQRLTACVKAGGQYVSGDCLRTAQ